jgi:hypothetical protein
MKRDENNLMFFGKQVYSNMSFTEDTLCPSKETYYVLLKGHTMSSTEDINKKNLTKFIKQKKTKRL